MAYLKTRRWRRYQLLKADGFLPFECRVLSKLPKATPALKAMRQDRRATRGRFDRKAVRLGYSDWKYEGEYRKLLKRKYKRNGWNVKRGPKGRQKGPAKGRPSAWKMYRDFEKRYPGKDYESPWEKRKPKIRKRIDPDLVVNLRTRLVEKRSRIVQGRRGIRRY